MKRSSWMRGLLEAEEHLKTEGASIQFKVMDSNYVYQYWVRFIQPEGYESQMGCKAGDGYYQGVKDYIEHASRLDLGD